MSVSERWNREKPHEINLSYWDGGVGIEIIIHTTTTNHKEFLFCKKELEKLLNKFKP